MVVDDPIPGGATILRSRQGEGRTQLRSPGGECHAEFAPGDPNLLYAGAARFIRSDSSAALCNRESLLMASG